MITFVHELCQHKCMCLCDLCEDMCILYLRVYVTDFIAIDFKFFCSHVYMTETMHACVCVCMSVYCVRSHVSSLYKWL